MTVLGCTNTTECLLEVWEPLVVQLRYEKGRDIRILFGCLKAARGRWLGLGQRRPNLVLRTNPKYKPTDVS